MIPSLPHEIEKVLEGTRACSNHITMHKNPTLLDLENAEKIMANNLSYLNEQCEKYSYLYESKKEEYDIAYNDSFHKCVTEDKTSAAVAKIEAKIACKEIMQNVLESKYLYKILKAFVTSRKDVLTSLCHRIKSVQTQSNRGY